MGAREDGAEVDFWVMRERGTANRAITYFSFGCRSDDDFGVDFWAEAKADGGHAPGDTLRPYAFPVSARGRVSDAKDVISPTLRGRLGKRAGKLKVKHDSCRPGRTGSTKTRVRRSASPPSGR